MRAQPVVAKYSLARGFPVQIVLETAAVSVRERAVASPRGRSVASICTSSHRRKIAHRLHPHVQSFGAPSSIQVLMRSRLDCGSAGAFCGMSEPHGGLVTFR